MLSTFLATATTATTATATAHSEEHASPMIDCLGHTFYRSRSNTSRLAYEKHLIRRLVSRRAAPRRPAPFHVTIVPLCLFLAVSSSGHPLCSYSVTGDHRHRQTTYAQLKLRCASRNPSVPFGKIAQKLRYAILRDR